MNRYFVQKNATLGAECWDEIDAPTWKAHNEHTERLNALQKAVGELLKDREVASQQIDDIRKLRAEFEGIKRYLESCTARRNFVRVSGADLVDAKGKKFFIRGINLSYWLNPEGYMFSFNKCSSANMIDLMFKQLVGPEETRRFWKTYKDNYITEDDIALIASTGSNTVRLPFNYKLFTDEDYLGKTGPGDGFERFDDVIGWCRKYDLKVILDMHACPGGNTGDNIDDSYGNAWLFEEESSQRQYCEIWRRIAARYAYDDTVLAYDLMNEPISNRLANMNELNRQLERVQFAAIDAIREVDRNHIVILAGGQWNGNFSVFSDFDKDSNMMYECHHYDFGNPEYNDGRVLEFAAFRDRSGKPMYMGETGHNKSYDWYRHIRESMEKNNIGWTVWPFKKPGDQCWCSFCLPDGWKDTIAAFAESDRSSYAEIQKNRPDRVKALALMREFVENCKAAHCRVDNEYLRALGFREITREG